MQQRIEHDSSKVQARRRLALLSGMLPAEEWATARLQDSGLTVGSSAPVQLLLDAPRSFALQTLVGTSPEQRAVTIVATWNPTPEAVQDLIDLGVGGLIELTTARHAFSFLIREALTAVERGDRYLRPSRVMCVLSPRQREALRLIVLGYPDGEIAARMGVKPGHVSNLVCGIYGRLGVAEHNRAALLRYYLGLAVPSAARR